MPSRRRHLAQHPLLTRITTVVLSGVWLVLSAPAPVVGERITTAQAPPSVRPVDGPLVRAFEQPPHAYGPGHRGADLAAAGGSAIRAARAGRVHWAGSVAGRGWVTLDHGWGLRTTYGVVQPSVSAGQRVRAGEHVGVLRAGRTHLDWGAYVVQTHGRHYIDPMLLLVDLRPVLVAPGVSRPGV